MDTPEERLRKRAQELEPEYERRKSAERQEESDVRNRVQRVRQVQQQYVRRAEELKAATKARIYLESGRGADGIQFHLLVGRLSVLSAQLGSSEWHVTMRFRRGQSQNHKYTTDEEFLNAKDSLLEPLIAEALEALYRGEEEPGPESDKWVPR